VALGSDYPYDMADEHAVSRVTQAGLSASSVELIMSENIRKFLNSPAR
jgi:predicted TIM-barrel fold metal-dependent hydrolase